MVVITLIAISSPVSNVIHEHIDDLVENMGNKVQNTLSAKDNESNENTLDDNPDDNTGGSSSTVSEHIYWGIDANDKLIISDEPVTSATNGRSGDFAGTDKFYTGNIEENSVNILSGCAWRQYGNEIKSIEIISVNKKVVPSDTSFWFKDLDNVTNADLSNLDTSRVTSMQGMFTMFGRSRDTVYISGLENWDTSNVTNMHALFSVWYPQNVYISDISAWNTSKVKYMGAMFVAAHNSDSSYKLDLSSWDVSSVTSYNNFSNMCNFVIPPNFQ